jgi:NADH dehydrogenase
MRELAQYVCSVTGRRRLIVGMPDWLARIEAWLWELTPAPLMSRDNLASMSVPSISDNGMPYGIVPMAMEAVAPAWLAPAGPRERYPELRYRARR